MINAFENENAFLSNFAESPIRVGAVIFPTMEHYFQASKTMNPAQYSEIAQAQTPGAAKRLGRTCTLRSDWEEIKDEVMLTGLRAKFSIPEFKEKLLATGTQYLEEGNWWGDRYWGVCKGTGQNMLGKLLMQVREELQLETGWI